MGELFAGPGFRTCSHAGCRWPAIATLGFDYTGRRAWLEDLKPERDPATYELCSVHAERFGPPRGWQSEDRRRLPEPLFDARGGEEIRLGSASPSPRPAQAALPEA